MKQAKVLTEKELKKVIDYIDAFDKHSHRNKVIVLLTHYCGMRVSEVASLLVSDVVNDEGEVNDVIHLTANQTKGSDSRRVFVSKKAKTALKQYLQSDLTQTHLHNLLSVYMNELVLLEQVHTVVEEHSLLNLLQVE